jgi:hypothetical protein
VFLLSVTTCDYEHERKILEKEKLLINLIPFVCYLYSFSLCSYFECIVTVIFTEFVTAR